MRATELARAQVSSIRTKLLKIGALVGISVRRIHFKLASSYPYMGLLRTVLGNIQAAYPLRI